MNLFTYETYQLALADSDLVNSELGYPNDFADTYSPILTNGTEYAIFADETTRQYISRQEVELNENWIDY